MIRHIVFFSAKNAADIDRIVDGLSMLGEIPSASHFEVKKNIKRDAISDDVDVVVYAEFLDEDALHAYKAHPLYEQAIKMVRPLRELRIAADIHA